MTDRSAMSGRVVSSSPPEPARGAATAGPWFILGMALVCGGVASIFNRAIGGTLLATGVLTAAVLFLARDRVRTLSRWTTGAAAAGAAMLCIGPFAAGAAMATTRLDGWTLLALGAALAAASSFVWARSVKQHNTNWEALRSVNEGEVLDLRAATFDVGRSFVYDPKPHPGGASGPPTRAVSAAAFAATLAAGFGRGSNADLRELVVMAVAPVVLLGLMPMVAMGVVTWRKIREYERTLGREIHNR